MKSFIKKIILEAAQSCDFKDLPDFQIDLPKQKTHGDYACNLAMQLARPLKKNPREIASQLSEQLTKQFGDFLDKVEIAGPGFLNLFLKEASYQQALKNILNSEKEIVLPDLGQGKKALVEFVSANPTGPMHIGHARNAVVGDVLARLLEALNFQVHREYYINDHGVQIQNLGRSAAYYLKKLLGETPEPLPEKSYEGEYLVDAVAKLKEKLIACDNDQVAMGKLVSLEILVTIQETLKSCNLVFDQYFSESSLYENNQIQNVLDILKENGKTFESEGALWFRTTDYGDDKDRVLIKSDGSYTYLTPDIAYHRNKFERDFDLYINVLGADHGGYLKRVKASIAAQGFDDSKLKFLLMQLVNVVAGQGDDRQAVKMSKRAGTVVGLDEVLSEVGVDATRFFLIMRSHNVGLDFDLNLAKEKNSDNPVFYVQYAHARCAAILRKAAEEFSIQESDYLNSDLTSLNLPEELDLIKLLLQFDEHLAIALDEFEPHRVVFFVLDLAKAFQAYYAKARGDDRYRVITDDKKKTLDKLYLIYVIKKLIAVCLKIIGVSAPESM